LTARRFTGQTMESLARSLAVRGVFVLRLRRGGQEMPIGWKTRVERGDVISVTGLRPEIDRVAALVGYAEVPTSATDLVLLGGGIFLGGLVGLLSVSIGRLDLGLGLGVGVLMAGMLLGYLRLIHPRFGRIPEASLRLL